ncbi:MAG TPA: FecR domain-containing protein [Candidatus Wallbacteria bacterium]|nr:FecR domain-containing protein [Candidatus Wallbacteria bacterium]
MKSASRLIVPVFIAALMLLVMSSDVFAQAMSAKIVALDGDVTVKKDNKGEWGKASLNQELPEGAYLMTAFESNCELEFVDKSKLKVKELSKIQINKFSTELKKVDAEVTLYNGSVKATVHKDVDTKTQFQVKTPVSTISVRGTEMDITTQPGFGTTNDTVSGVVEVTTSTGQSTTVPKDQKTQVSEDAQEPPKDNTQIVRNESRADVTNESTTKEEDKGNTTAGLVPSSTVGTGNSVTSIVEDIVRQEEMGKLTVRWK